MVQNPKGGGLSSSFGGSQQLGGVQNTTNFLDKSTWTLATALIFLIIASSLSFENSLTAEPKLDEKESIAPKETTSPATPAKSSTQKPVAEPKK
jgi:preprotein translocase subunit SecG